MSDVERDIKRRKLKLLGHVVRTGLTMLDKKIFERRPNHRRKVGKPRLRWLKYVENDL